MGAYMIQQLRGSKRPIRTEKIKDGGPCATEDANLPHIHWKFCLPCLQDTDHSIYLQWFSPIFPGHMVSSLTVQKNEIINRPAVLCIFRFPQLLAMSPATFWATFFLASGEIGESPIYMSKKASAHQTRISLVKCERGTSYFLYISLSVDSLSALSYVLGVEYKESKVQKV